MNLTRWHILNWCLVTAWLILAGILLWAIAHGWRVWICVTLGAVVGAASPVVYLISCYFAPPKESDATDKE